MSELSYYLFGGIIAVLVLWGISLMRKVPSARLGNLINAIATVLAVVLVLVYHDIIKSGFHGLIIIFGGMAIGSFIGLLLAYRVKMIQMPEMVALLNGVGGAASALIGAITIFNLTTDYPLFEKTTAVLALAVGIITFVGSMIAAGKLAKILDGKSVILKQHSLITILLLGLLVTSIILNILFPSIVTILLVTVFSNFFSIVFVIRVGGADMPVTISLLNSLSGVAGALAGLALANIPLIAIGSIVGSSGLVLTQIMSKAMNRPLKDILIGIPLNQDTPTRIQEKLQEEGSPEDVTDEFLEKLLKNSKRVIIVPGYGMALAQAQHLVERLARMLEDRGAEVIFAIHPVAGRMPGHMNILLAEAGVDYDKLYEMDDVNPLFETCECAIIVGANDVVNPAAREAVGTPIYGMPILNVDYAKHVIICNYDKKPGYSGIDNPMYHKTKGISMLLGDAKDSLNRLINLIK
ncbi:MAG TPA: NAD(P)(+) transhydrogenase (Re/Si-specific) subunit beta [Acholeplasmataceae bacterium]|jgi:NAD(P) transhydrogenase subunit beta|nr:NAD(P)(+) transhydrogenase (Re/Si-specific) subunit beta [Acholeplasmataceae bacterium]